MAVEPASAWVRGGIRRVWWLVQGVAAARAMMALGRQPIERRAVPSPAAKHYLPLYGTRLLPAVAAATLEVGPAGDAMRHLAGTRHPVLST